MTTLQVTSGAPRPAGLSAPTRELLRYAERQGWGSSLLGYAPLPEAPVRAGNWLIVPAHLDTSPLPERTRARIATIFENGLRPAGFVVVHEAPKLLPATLPAPGSEPVAISFDPPARRKAKRMLALAPLALGAGALAVAGAVVLAALVAVALVAAAGVGLVILLGAAISTIDPLLVAVMEDGAWVEIDRWWA